MTTDASTTRLRTAALTSVRLLADVLILGLWIVFLTLVFLGTGWPRWAFYLAAILGAALYVRVTPAWF